MDSNVIQSILEIDRKAREKLDEAEKKKQRIIADAREEKERIISGRISAADDELKKLEAENKEKAKEKLSVLEQKSADEIAALEMIYEERHSKWTDEIFEAVINS